VAPRRSFTARRSSRSDPPSAAVRDFTNNVSPRFVGRDSPQVATRIANPACANPFVSRVRRASADHLHAPVPGPEPDPRTGRRPRVPVHRPRGEHAPAALPV